MRKYSSNHCFHQATRQYVTLTKNLAPAFLALFLLSACESDSDGFSDLIEESDWVGEGVPSTDEDADNVEATDGDSDGDDTDSDDDSESSDEDTVTTSSDNSSTDTDTTTTTPSNNTSTGGVTTTPSNNTSSGDTDSSSGDNTSSGDTDISSGDNTSSGDTDTSSGDNTSSGETDTSSSDNTSSGDTDTSSGDNTSSGDTDTSSGDNTSSGDTDTSSGDNTSSGDADTSSGDNTSSGDTDTSSGDNTSSGDTDSSSGDNTSSGDTDSSSGETSEPDVGAAQSGKQLPFIEFKAPPVNLPSKPGLRKEVKISAAGTAVKRISDFTEFATGKMPHFNASDDSQLAFAYARHHPFSKDNTYILGNGGWRWRALWKADGTYVREITQAGSGNAVWANTENDYIYLVDTDSKKSFSKTNVLTDQRTVLRTFSYPISIGESEGDISDDDKRVAFSSNNNGRVRITAYDIEQNTYTEKTLSRSFSDLDWVSVSRSGQYILVAYHKGARNVELYNWDLSYVRRIANQKHGDIGWDENGDECWFAIGHLEPSLSRTTIGKWRLSDNAYTEVLGGAGRFTNRPDSLSGHISARASDRVPGVIHVSIYDPEGPYTMFALKTDGSERIQFFGWHGSDVQNYYDNPHFATNRTGDVGIFKSNWGHSDDPTEMYLIYKDPDK